MTGTKLVIQGPRGTQKVRLEPAGVTLGRGSNCSIKLDHDNVSRVHARISQDPFGRWIVEDMNSHNGVLVDGQRIKMQAVQYGQTISIRPFDLSVVEEREREVNLKQSSSNIPIVDMGADEQIVSYRDDETAIFSPALMQQLNELGTRLLQLSSPSELYAEASSFLARTHNTLVAIIRLPDESQPLPQLPDVLALYFGKAEANANILAKTYIHFSKRVLDAARRTNSPVMAGSHSSPGENLHLTVVDEHKPHLVFAAQVNRVGESVDVLYIDIPDNQAPDNMFDFVEAIARQINFAQKSLFLAELEKQERALREANEQLKQKDRIKDEYVSRVTHDIKGHLAAIQNCLYVVNEAAAGTLSEQGTDFLNRAENRTQQLAEFVRELLRLTRMRLHGQIEMASFSLPDILQKSLVAIENKAEEKSITVTSEIEATLGHMVGNEFSLTETVTNLLFNAVKYTPEGKTVHLAALDRGEQVQIDIVDTGIGIPAHELDNVFDEFFRATNAKQSGKEGTGLGLSIVKQIIDQHGGSISVLSEEGQGSTFTVTLPKGSV